MKENTQKRSSNPTIVKLFYKHRNNIHLASLICPKGTKKLCRIRLRTCGLWTVLHMKLLWSMFYIYSRTEFIFVNTKAPKLLVAFDFVTLCTIESRSY